ncbi:MAG: metallophosphoesterase [Bacteroidales bacterium]|nr:metallophosphoesterase [Bacteroidales bacterium]
MIYKINTEAVFCLGDIHGALKGIAGHIKRYDLKDCALIFCGDIGFGFDKMEYYQQTYRKLLPLLNKQNIYCFFIRGNHDNPDFYDDKTIAYKRFVAVKDYSVIQTFAMEDTVMASQTHSILCVGGAISIDRIFRKQKMLELAMKYKRFHSCDINSALQNTQKLYWENEPPYIDYDALTTLANDGIRIDTVCTHTCPPFCEPISKDGISLFLELDPTLEKDIDDERKTMEELWKHLRNNGHPLSTWCYGHFHYHRNDLIEGVRFYLLDMERNGIYDMVEAR